ncbi:HET-domain-containing protein [Venturia nashicola]|nr:HET-domain-containing protein [Venturia nashicola]
MTMNTALSFFPSTLCFTPSEVSLNFDVPEISANEQQKRSEASDPSSIELIKGWLGKCQKSHTKCETAKQTILPTRVLCVGKHGDEMISVWVPGHGDKGSYLALSYCWGNGATVTATPEALPELLRGFSLSKLPRTLREAVQTTRDLGFVYLWIDSLCILQGNSLQARLDWVQEPARMDEIYANAVVTIIASASSSCDQGLFYPRTCLMQYEGSFGRDQTFATLSISGYPRSYHDEPIHKRAWTLQERLLSSRVLSYCLQDLMWQCNEVILWERDPPETIRQMHKERLQDEKFDWAQITNAYASRSVTMCRDKLPALSAVAKRYHESSHDQYLAGLWREDLLKQLLWYRTSHRNMNSPNIRPSVLLEYQAPSWSWASLDCSVRSRQYSSFVARVVSCSVTPATPDPFGMVSEGELVIESPFLLGSVFLQSSLAQFRVDDQMVAYVWPDEDDINKREDADTSKSTSAVVIAARGNRHYGLLLRPSKAKPDCYVRIGKFRTLRDSPHLLTQKVMEFTII